MKKLLLAFVALIAVTTLQAKDTPIKLEQLPAAAQTFLSTNLALHTPTLITKHDDTYRVRYGAGCIVEFNKKGEWIEFAWFPSVPYTFLSATINQYIKANYPNSSITRITKTKGGCSVWLNDETELTFESKDM